MATQVSDTGGKTRTRGTTADELAVIAQRAQAFTGASGTAIALSEGNGEEIVCRARSGAAAPEVGTALRVEGSFTGLCIQSGKELRCDDAETDTRVDTAAIRALGIRSMVVTPIKEDNRVVGVLAVFAPTAHAFTITHVAVLKTMADQIAQLLKKERRSTEDGPEPEEPAMMPGALARPSPPMATPVPAPVVIKPAAHTPISMPRPASSGLAKVEPIRATAVVEPLAAPVTPARRVEERHPEPKSQPQQPPVSFGTFDAVGAQAEKSGSRWIFLVAGVVVLAAVATYGYLRLHKTPAPAAHTQVPAPAVNVEPAAPIQSTPSVSASDTSLAAPASSSSSVSAAPAKPKDESADSGKKADKNSAKPSPAAEARQTPEAVALTSGPSRITAPVATDASQSAPDAPSLTVGGSSASGNLKSLTAPRETSAPSMVTQSTTEPLKIIKRVLPVYPPAARLRLQTGTVILEAVVDTNGRVKQVRMVSGSPIFREAAIDAVKEWQYQPAKLNGQAIEQTTIIQRTFKP